MLCPWAVVVGSALKGNPLAWFPPFHLNGARPSASCVVLLASSNAIQHVHTPAERETTGCELSKGLPWQGHTNRGARASIATSQFPRKSVNLFFILVIIKDKLTDLNGN